MKVDKRKWERKKLDNLCSLITKGTTPTSSGYKFVDNGINFVKVESFTENGELIEEKMAHITKECNESLKRSQLENNDILYSIAGAIGRIAVVSDYILPANTNQALAIIRLKNKNLSFIRFLIYLLKSDYVKRQSVSLMKGVAQLNLSLSQIRDLFILIPPLSEQQAIASELDAIQDLISKHKEQLKDYDNLAKSIFNEMFGDVVSNEKGWERKKLGDVCIIIRGPFGGSLKKECFVENGYAVYEQQNAIYNKYTFRYFINEAKYQELKRFSISPGDIIMSCAGTMGKVSIVPSDAQKGIINQALMKFTLSNAINSTYLIFLLSSVLIQDGISNQAKGVAMKNIAAVGTIKNQIIPLPPLSLQQTFAHRIEAIEKQKELVKQQITDLQTLFDSRMQYYFD